MKVTKTAIEGVFIIEPVVFEDERGYFFESYNQADLKRQGIDYNFIQDNQSKSRYGTIRGIHFQKGEFSQAKLVRVLEGTVLDVAVDLRKNSPTFGQHIAVELSAENKRQLMIPRGFGHGFSVLSDTAVFAYKCDNVYNKASESGILYNDPALNIDWKIDIDKAILSEKDKNNPLLEEVECF
ncbi:MAG: dTDP-4-dehydrorhamnose 3,5-epimerase [Alphaproteobacteria bacterium]|nr:dTDP-4-dehydrorhamnose 3,5-epimerase [Alphaproteobacteria bacterium]